MQIRAIYNCEDEDGVVKEVKSQWMSIYDFDPVNGAKEFDWSNGMYSGFDDIDWESELKFEFKN